MSPVRADRQRIAPGTALQGEVVVNTGGNGICQTTAQGDDVQAAQVGFGTAFEDEIRCGQDAVASTTAGGDDRQLVAVGADCQNRNSIVVDTGPDGIANTAATADDVQLIPAGSAARNTPCVRGRNHGRPEDPVSLRHRCGGALARHRAAAGRLVQHGQQRDAG